MLFSYITLFALGSAGLINGAVLASDPVSGRAQKSRFRGVQSRQSKDKPNQTCLAANALQTASEKTGQEAGTDGIKAGQAPSAT